MGAEHSTSAAFAAASRAFPAVSDVRACFEVPRGRPGDEAIFGGRGAEVGFEGGALPRVRPGEEKLSWDSLPQRLPMLMDQGRWASERSDKER